MDGIEELISLGLCGTSADVSSAHRMLAAQSVLATLEKVGLEIVPIDKSAGGNIIEGLKEAIGQ